MTDYDALIEKYSRQLTAALSHLERTFSKIEKLPTTGLSDDELEVWESFVARFGRAGELFLSRLLRAKISRADPGFSGSFRDALHLAEKLGFIEDSGVWLEIRELRNKSAHEYAEEKLDEIFADARALAPHLLALK